MTGADVQDPGQRAVPGGLLVFAETSVFRVDVGGVQGVLLEGEPIHFNPFKIVARLKAS